MTIPLPSMREDISGLIDDWGVEVSILRRVGTLDDAGRNSVNYATVGTDEMWIQPMSPERRARMQGGVVAAVSHIGVKRYASFGVKKEDRIASPSEAYVYDVTDVENWPTHQNIYMNLVKRDV